jgi:hypothetical protein
VIGEQQLGHGDKAQRQRQQWLGLSCTPASFFLLFSFFPVLFFFKIGSLTVNAIFCSIAFLD